MYSIIKTISDEREIGLSDLMREAIEQYLEKVASSQEVHRG
jgi:predicted nucleic-acid-binding protein